LYHRTPPVNLQRKFGSHARKYRWLDQWHGDLIP